MKGTEGKRGQDCVVLCYIVVVNSGSGADAFGPRIGYGIAPT